LENTMNDRWTLALSLLLAVALTAMILSCAEDAPPSPEASAQTQADYDSIRAFFDRYASTWTDGLGDEYMALLSKDIIAMVPGAPAVVGKKAIWEGMGPVFEYNKLNFSISVEEMRVAGDWAFVRTSLTFRGAPKSGEKAFEGIGKAVYIVERDPTGSWRIARDIYNWDHPLPPAQ
jgi:uncharacterized protein (TIGR02246 family)